MVLPTSPKTREGLIDSAIQDSLIENPGDGGQQGSIDDILLQCDSIRAGPTPFVVEADVIGDMAPFTVSPKAP
jgi:hypothetical protein